MMMNSIDGCSVYESGSIDAAVSGCKNKITINTKEKFLWN
jgi:hypothetical protein